MTTYTVLLLTKLDMFQVKLPIANVTCEVKGLFVSNYVS